ncbi:MAG: 2-oxoglutarate dehydrogenase E1 component [Bdellovibrio sp.]|nr:2-oxoglutarate dehydrogenase E1 component [Bdellovibrio sp.]
MNKHTYLNSQNANYIDELYRKYHQNPNSIEPSWRYFFEGFELTQEVKPPTKDIRGSKETDLINAYREKGKFLANIDPLSEPPIKETYCSTIAVEFTHIEHREAREWLQEKMESTKNTPALTNDQRKKILQRLTQSEAFEKFLHTRYVAQKRFSLEGGESLIIALDCMIETGSNLGAKEFVLGMAHRGRLNVLTHIFGKKLEYIFTEFEAKYQTNDSLGEGDVKYHKGYSADISTLQGKTVHLSLASNPSHLEAINPVIEGITRAKQELHKDKNRIQVIPVTIHGDAALSGQGICYETLNLSQLDGYTTGGTLHIVVNNQIGFTAIPQECRSTTYCTDLAKMLDIPIFHVNGDDPEAVWFVSKLATEYRQKFNTDVFIDIICYRRHGHNESDEPAFTQPAMYKKIKAHHTTREIYEKKLVKSSILTEIESKNMFDEIMLDLTQAQKHAQEKIPQPYVSVFEGQWSGFRQPTYKDIFTQITTSVSEEILKQLSDKLNHVPPTFALHPKLNRFFKTRNHSVQEGCDIDWGNGEILAYATLLLENHAVRLSGQDSGRGTFTHRHAILYDYNTNETYIPLNHLDEKQAPFFVYNSHLSEAAVMGFEFGYSLANPRSLVIWEAQFGDFANGAQVIIDQFISSSESKWQRMSGLVLLLPHGYEGQGPEHSSARLERFLSLCGKNNIIVCNLTTPAQLFHALRRQIKWVFRKPLIIMSPKSLLRHPLAVSDLSEFTKHGFQEVIDDPVITEPNQIKRLLICSGKIYYDLFSERSARKLFNIALIRIEQLYPWPETLLASTLNRYKNVSEIFWVQEEPQNMGAWSFVSMQLLSTSIVYIGREIGAAPAVGSSKLHEQEQKEIIDQALKVN